MCNSDELNISLTCLSTDSSTIFSYQYPPFYKIKTPRLYTHIWCLKFNGYDKNMQESSMQFLKQ